MSAGRPTTPTALKALRGTLRAGRVNPAEPQAPAMELGAKAPAWVKGPKARAAWRDLVKLLTDQRVLTVMDSMALGLLVDAFEDYLASGEDIATEGPYYWSKTEGGGSIRRRNPAVEDRKDAWLRIERMLGKFGMNPSDRAKVKITAEAEEDPIDKWMRAG